MNRLDTERRRRTQRLFRFFKEKNPLLCRRAQATAKKTLSHQKTSLINRSDHLSICTHTQTKTNRKIERVKSLMIWQMNWLFLPIGYLKKWAVNYQKSAFYKTTGRPMANLRTCTLPSSVFNADTSFLPPLSAYGQHPFFKTATTRELEKVHGLFRENTSQSHALSFRQAWNLACTLSIMYHCLSLSRILLSTEL